MAAALLIYLSAAWGTTGQTWGDLLFGLRVVDHRGGRLRPVGTILRAALCVVFPIGILLVPVNRANRSVADAVLRTSVVAAASSFAAISTLLGSPLLGAFLLMEASGLGGPLLGVVLLPGLLAAGVGALVFAGLDAWTGLGAFSLSVPGPMVPAIAMGMGAMSVVSSTISPRCATGCVAGRSSASSRRCGSPGAPDHRSTP
ncbi:MAG: RDD family protein [Streptosporangiaceae bacterium]|nr:RDD family protein [Streptosporangiaceae bacterium]